LALFQPKVFITVMKVLKKSKRSYPTAMQYERAIAFSAHSKINANKCVNELVGILEELLEREVLVD